MLGPTAAEPTAPLDSPTSGAAGIPAPRKSRFSLLTARDRVVLGLMVGVPTFLFIGLIWVPTIASIVLSFTNWRGIGPIDFKGLTNYVQLFTTYPFFWPALI